MVKKDKVHGLKNSLDAFKLIGIFFCGFSTPFLSMAYPYGASGSHTSDTPHSVGLLCNSDQPDAKTCT